MYCQSCGVQVTAALSYCNRCGAGLREREQSRNTGSVIALLSAIALLGLGGMGIMVGGSLALLKEAGLPPGFVVFFMFFIFVITAVTEFFLVRTLSRLTSGGETRPSLFNAQEKPLELRAPAAAGFGEPFSSVTDNTTRTLGYAPRER